MAATKKLALGEAKRTTQEVDAEAMKLMEKVSVHIKVYHPFFGALLSRLKFKLDRKHPTMYTDAVVIGFNPEFVMALKFEHLIYITVHEVEHCALRHPFRRGNRDPQMWNEAIDHVVNLALNADSTLASMRPPPHSPAGCGLADERFAGLAGEQVYSILEMERGRQSQQEPDDQAKSDDQMPGQSGKAGDCCDAGSSGEPFNDEENNEDEENEEDEHSEDEGSGDGSSQSQGDPGSKPGGPQGAGRSDSGDAGEDEGDEGGGGDGEEDPDADQEEGEGGEGEAGSKSELSIKPPKSKTPGPADLSQLEREWGEAVMTAVLAAGGEVGEGMRRALGAAQQVRMSFQDYLDQFLHRCFNDGETWKRPNRRYSDAYLPSRGAPSVKKLVVGVDTSSSIDDGILATFERALEKLVEEWGCDVLVLHCDTRIRAEQEFTRYDSIKLEPEGGGGTAFAPVFARAREMIDAGDEVVGVVYLTDLQGHVDGWRKYEDIETLWVSTEAREDYLWYGAPKFGTVCSIFD